MIGGDGTILRAAELTHARRHPAARRQPRPRRLPRRGGVRRRRVHHRGDRRAPLHLRGAADHRRAASSEGKELVCSTCALNEASVEKAARERMLEVVVEIDGRPLSRWGCDGVVCATPTGSTAYNFSAGGPVVWPGVEALLMVPISAHALFARPMVVAPTSVLAVEVLEQHRRRRRAVVRRSPHRRPAAGRPHRGTPRHAPRCGWSGCTTRRSPTGWSPSSACRSRAGAAPPSAAAATRQRRRGRRGPMLEEIRIRSLGVIDSSTLELGPGLTAITGETGAGKTMVVTALGLLLGGRADTGAVRTGAKAARVEGVVQRRGPARRSPPRSRSSAARSRTTGCCWPAHLRRGPLPRVRRRRVGAGVPARRARRRRWSPCTASPTSTGCCGRPPSARRSTASAATTTARAAATATPTCTPSCARPRPSSPRW